MGCGSGRRVSQGVVPLSRVLPDVQRSSVHRGGFRAAEQKGELT